MSFGVTLANADDAPEGIAQIWSLLKVPLAIEPMRRQ